MYNQKHDPEWIIVSGVVINEHSQSGSSASKMSEISKHVQIILLMIISNTFKH